MRVLHVIDSGGFFGAESMLLNLVAEQLGAGMDPMILSLGDRGVGEKPIEREALRRQLPITPLRFGRGINLRGIREILRFAHSHGYDVLHSHGYKPNILLGFLPRNVRKMPLVSTLHGWTSTSSLSRIKIYETLDALSLRFVDRVVLVSPSMRSHPRLQSSKLKVEVVENGIPDHDIASAPVLDQDVLSFCNSGIVFCAIGRLSREKGFDVLVEAINEARTYDDRIKLLLIGAGKERENLLRMVDDLKLQDAVMFAGYLDKPYRYFKFCQGLVVSSHTEGLPIVVLEAMRSGFPIISTDVGGISHVLSKTGRGMLVPPGNSRRLAEAMVKTVSSMRPNADYANDMKRVFHKYYTARRMEQGYQSIYTSLLKERLYA